MSAIRTLALGLLTIGTLALPAGAGVIYRDSYYTDAYLNLGNGPYEESANLTAGNPRPWYESPVVKRVYGGTPNDAQKHDFEVKVYERIKSTYERSGIDLELTNNPDDPVAHSLSVVSGTDSPSNPGAVGITTMGGSGFTFIDGLKYANTVDELEWAVAHNVAHELMHAFGAGHHDETGDYLDAGVTRWETLVDPNAKFSSTAVSDLSSRDFRQYRGGYYYYGGLWGGQEVSAPDVDGTLLAAPVPEPATMALWLVGAASIGVARLRRRGRRAA